MNGCEASLIIPSYRGASRLGTLLSALSNQDADCTWEALVVIDGVTDNSEAVIESFESLPVRAIVLDQNQGRSAALNAGFDAASGRVLVRCDDDLVPAPDYVRRHVEAHEGPVVVGAIGLYRNVLPSTPYATIYGQAADRNFRRIAYATDTSGWWRYWAGNCSVTRATYDAVGPYDTDFREYGWEDVDWGYRLMTHGARVELVRELETPHRVAATTTAIRANRAYLSGAARRRFELKHPEAVQGAGHAPTDSGGLKPRLWNEVIRGIARMLNDKRATSVGRQVDAVLTRVPRAVGVKLVAAVVESAGQAGHRPR